MAPLAPAPLRSGCDRQRHNPGETHRTQLIGYLGRDREIKTTRHGKDYVLLNIATNTWVGGERRTTWHRCIGAD